ncbi:MAG: hypothetical protein HUJ68_06235 [Clostridia bacterium]|nr:hypothetical protein [Clostridia bacterium]
MKLDYSLTSPEERCELVKKIIEENGEENISPNFLQVMTDYLIFCMEKQEKKQKQILTDNRMTTVNKRETSKEALTEKLENGEDGLYNLIANDKNIIFTPSISITKDDLNTIQPLHQLREAIDAMVEKSKTAVGKDAFRIKRAIIELRQEQYTIKAAYRKPIYFLKIGKGSQAIDWDEDIWVDENKDIHYSGRCTIYNPKHVSALLTNYNRLVQDSYEDLNSDIRWQLKDLENIIEKHIKPNFPVYYDIIIYKLDGRTNAEIRSLLEKDHGITHSLEYISSLYRNKIPKLIAEAAQNEWLIWYYTNQEKGEWKTCSKCKETKLVHSHYFSKNRTARSGYYSICKKCRARKKEV